MAAFFLGGGYLNGGTRGLYKGAGVLAMIACGSIIGPVILESSPSWEGPCWAFPKEPSRQMTKPARIILDNVSEAYLFGPASRFTLDRIALLTGAEVVEFSRRDTGHIGDVHLLKSVPMEDCRGSEIRKSIEVKGTQWPLDRCLKRTRLMESGKPLAAELALPYIGPTVEFAGSPSSKCLVVQVYETDQVSRRLIARFVQTWGEGYLLRPPLDERVLKAQDPNVSLISNMIMSVLSDDLSEAALNPYLR